MKSPGAPVPPLPRGTSRTGFTLVEVLVVIAILGVLAGIAVPAYQNYVERARVKRAVAEIHQIENLIDGFELEYRNFPPDLASVDADTILDPWGNPYVYLRIAGPNPPTTGQVRKDKSLNPINSDYDLYSMGANGDTKKPLTAPHSHDDIVRANDGNFVGLAIDY